MGNKYTCCNVKDLKENEINKNKKIETKNFLKFTEENIITTSRTNSEPNEMLPQIKKIVLIQKNFLGYLSRKAFKDNIELLKNIYTLDSTVNLITDPEDAKRLLELNKGEQLSKTLLEKGLIKPYSIPRIISKYTINTKLTYVDKYKNNDMYVGGISYEKIFNGYGIFYSNNNKYEGIWINGKLNGPSRYFLSNGDFFDGYMINDIANGEGRYVHSDGNKYIGSWARGFPNGQGKEIYPDGSFFVGSFNNGEKTKGKMTWKDGSSYEGTFKNGNFNGKGTFKWIEGREYIGDWVNGKMEGKGVMNYSNGTRYEGEFHNSKRWGYGKYIWNENKTYEGGWYAGKQNGNGTYKKGDNVLKGVWKDGKITNMNSTRSTEVSRNDSKVHPQGKPNSACNRSRVSKDSQKKCKKSSKDLPEENF